MMKEYDVISIETYGTKCTAVVNWATAVDAGITYLSPEQYRGGASVVPISDCTVIKEYREEAKAEMPDYSKLSTEELKASIERLRGMRFPKKVQRRPSNVVRKPKPTSTEKRIIDLAKEKGVSADELDALIEKVKESDRNAQ